MEELQIHITTDSCLFCKDPESSDLGRRIVEYGIEMIHELGYEAFTFKKLCMQMEPQVLHFLKKIRQEI